MPTEELERFDAAELTEIKFAAGDKSGSFEGYASVFKHIDSHGDIVEPGAFSKSLQDWGRKGKLPKMLLMHGGGFFGGAAEDMLPVGKWTSMVENAKGLKVRGELFAIDSTDKGRLIYEGMSSGELDGLSIGFKTIKARNGSKPGDPERWLEEIDLREVSIVTWGSNDKALVTGVKSADIDRINSLSDAEAFLRDAGGPGWSKKMATKFVSHLAKIARRDAGDDRLSGLLQSIKAQRLNPHL